MLGSSNSAAVLLLGSSDLAVNALGGQVVAEYNSDIGHDAAKQPGAPSNPQRTHTVSWFRHTIVIEANPLPVLTGGGYRRVPAQPGLIPSLGGQSIAQAACMNSRQFKTTQTTLR